MCVTYQDFLLLFAHNMLCRSFLNLQMLDIDIFWLANSKNHWHFASLRVCECNVRSALSMEEKEFVHSNVHSFLTWNPDGGWWGFSRIFRIAVCRESSQTLTLIKDEANENWYPIKAQNSKNDTLFKGKAKSKNGTNGSTLFRFCNIESNLDWSLLTDYLFFGWPGIYKRTAVLADTI